MSYFFGMHMHVNLLILLLFLSAQGCFVSQPYGETRKRVGKKVVTTATKELLQLVPRDKDFLINLRRLAKSGADFSAKNITGRTVLHEIVLRGGSVEAAQFVARQLDDVDVVDDEDNTPLVYAVYENNLPLARVLTEHGADPNVSVPRDGLLHDAVMRNRVELAMLLVEHKADPNNTTGSEEYTAMHKVEDIELAKFLFNHDGNPNVRDEQGNTPLISIIGGDKHGDFELLKVFIEHQADVNAENEFGSTPLHKMAEKSTMSRRLVPEKLRKIKLLLENGADPNHLNKRGESRLCCITQSSAGLLYLGSCPPSRYWKQHMAG